MKQIRIFALRRRPIDQDFPHDVNKTVEVIKKVLTLDERKQHTAGDRSSGTLPQWRIDWA